MHLHPLSVHLALGFLIIGETLIAPLLAGEIVKLPAIVALQSSKTITIGFTNLEKTVDPVLGYEPPPDIGKPKRTGSSGGRFT